MKRFLLIAALGSLAWAGVANAESVYLRYDYDGPAQTGNFSPNTTGYSNFYIGRSNFTQFDGPDGNVIGHTTAYCIDVNHLIWSGQSFWFDLLAPEVVPVPGVSAHASDLRRLFYLAAPSAADDANKCAAIAAAVWEVVNETWGTYGLADGNFTVSRNSGGDWTSTANGWLNQINTNRSEIRLANVTAYYDAATQSFAFAAGGSSSPPVPEPITMLTAFVAISGLGMYIRKRVRPVA